MTRDEFGLWYKTHRASFPEIDSWMGKQGNREEVLATWRNTLRDVEFSDACCVSTDMGTGDLPGPKMYGDTARDVRRAAKERNRPVVLPRRRTIDGEITYACRLCFDDGWVLCWHPATIKQLRKDGELTDAFKPYRCVVACSCVVGEKRLGQKWATELRKGNMNPPRYDARDWCRVDDWKRFEQQKADLVAWYRGTAIVADQTADSFEWKGRPTLEFRPIDDDHDVVDEQ